MAASFAIFTSHPALLACQLARVQGQVLLDDGAPPNAVGVGSYAQDDVLLQRQPAHAAPPGLSAFAPAEASEAVLYQGQRLPAAASLEDSAQPFRFRRWLFMYDGKLPGFPDFRRDLQASLPPYLRRQIGVETEGEAAFSLFLKGLRDAGRTDDRRLDAQLAADLLGQAARGLARESSRSGAAHMADVALIASNGHLLAAVRLGQAPLYYRPIEGSPECERCGLKRGRSEVEPLVRAHVLSRAVAVASHVASGAHWLELPFGTALAVGSDLEPVQRKV